MGQVLRQAVMRDIPPNGVRIQSLSDSRLNPSVMLPIWLRGQQERLDVDQAIVRWQEDSVQLFLFQTREIFV